MRGGTVNIPLKIYGTRAQTLSWIIKQRPQYGKLSEVRQTGAESGVVTYTPPADLHVVADRFTFSVRSNEGVSAPVAVTISIVDTAPRISAPGELDFGTLLPGASVEKTFEFSNVGGGIAEGTFEVDAPWKVDGARSYKLAPGLRRAVKIVFLPERAGAFESEVRFTSQPDTVVALKGAAEEALAVNPKALVLTQDAGRPLRAASFEVRNNTDAPLDATVSASPRLIMRKSQRIAAHAAAVFAVQTAETDVTELEDTVEISAGALSVRIPVSAPALPALVRARPESVFFRNGAGGKETVIFTNRGGTAAKVTLAIGTPFSVAESRFSLRPGEEKEVAISAAKADAQGVLKVGVGETGFEIPVEAGGLAGTFVMPVARRTSPTARARKEADSGEPLAVHSGPFAAAIESVSASSGKFRWSGLLPEGAEFRCFQQTLSTDDEGELVSEFHEYTACRFGRDGGFSTATVEGLQPGKSYLFRIDEVRAASSMPVTFAQIRTPAPEVPESSVSIVKLLVGLVVIAGELVVWQRLRA